MRPRWPAPAARAAAPSSRTIVGQRAPLEVLEGDVEGVALGVAAEVVHGHDRGVREQGRRARLGHEARFEGRAVLVGGGEADVDRLQGDGAAEDGIDGAVDDAHHPAADLAGDLVPSEDLRLALAHCRS